MAQTVKGLPTMWETQFQSLGWEDPLEKEMATQYSCLEISMDREAWWATQSMGLQRAGHDSVTNTFTLITLTTGWVYVNCLPVRAEEE